MIDRPPVPALAGDQAGGPRVTVVLPCRNEARYLGACLDSILEGRYAGDRLEILVVDGQSDDGTRAIADAYAAGHAGIRVLDNPDRIVPTALNIGIRAATGDVIARLDAHVLYPPEYLPRLVAALRETGADNVGGRLVTLPANGTPLARAIALALAHPFGVGNSHFRIGTAERRWVDTVPFGCFPRDVFRRVGLFDEELVRNQDDEFNLRLIRQGGRILLAPDVVSYYYARGSRRQLARMYYQYGYFKPLVARKMGRVMTVRQLVPAAFVTALLGGAGVALAWPPAALAWVGMVALYALLVLGASLHAGHRYGARCAAALLGVFPTIHLSYGVGYLRGLGDLLMGGRARGRDPAAVPLSR
jgi:glycosyltransferase involved in cell wall biosynthesis